MRSLVPMTTTEAGEDEGGVYYLLFISLFWLTV